ncbi:hypothetical protein THAOC_06091, partial [Thalassiosira oceanica]
MHDRHINMDMGGEMRSQGGQGASNDELNLQSAVHIEESKYPRLFGHGLLFLRAVVLVRTHYASQWAGGYNDSGGPGGWGFGSSGGDSGGAGDPGGAGRGSGRSRC